MKLQILVPHYKEKPAEIEPLLDSIAIQQSVDFHEVGVIIAYDGDDAEELPAWDKYPFKIEHLHADKGGVSATRNAALDASTAEYVMFCDADDMFYSVCALYIIFNEIEVGFDTLTSLFIEESRTPDRKQIIYINHEVDSTFVHGKVHRKQYLIDNNIRFNPNLTIHEDSYFNILARELAPADRAKYCPTPFYLWKWRDESVCRHDPDYILKTYNNMIDSNDALVDQFKNRGVDDKARFYVGFMLFDAYYTMNKKEWIDKTHRKYRQAVERRFSQYYKKHIKEWSAITEQEKMIISNGIRSRSVGEGMPMESITMDDWLKHVEKIK
jgi:glycosyltransferase involved in cell wall biosynthesis